MHIYRLVSILLSTIYIQSYYSIADLKQQSFSEIKSVTVKILSRENYIITKDKIDIQYKPLSINIVVHTNNGKKFLKLHDKGNGIREYAGAKAISGKLSVIEPEALIEYENFELIVQPFIENIHKTILFNIIENFSFVDSVTFVKTMFLQMLQVVDQHMEYAVQETFNDNLFFKRLKTERRDNQSGRIEIFYRDKSMNLAGLEINWNLLLHKQVSVDGVVYQETLAKLLDNAYHVLHPKNPRLVSLCHGDWHEMNLYADITNNEMKVCYVDCEYAGINDVIGDAVVYLIYNSVLMPCLAPKYYFEQFENIDNFEVIQNKLNKQCSKYGIEEKNGIIIIKDFNTLGLNETRKQLTYTFLDTYLNPLIKNSSKRYGVDSEETEERLKACILARLLGVYNISLMEPADQLRVFAFIFKTIGTPVFASDNSFVLSRFVVSL